MGFTIITGLWKNPKLLAKSINNAGIDELSIITDTSMISYDYE